MTRSKRMQSVVEVTANREREAARRLGEAQTRAQAATQRLDELIRYREEYTRQFADNVSLPAARLQDYRVFLNRLNQAVEAQQKLLARAEQDCATQRSVWMEIHTRAKALDKVALRYRDAERSDQDRREQKETDEHSSTLRKREED
ncbi:MAG: flagellar export protein FliJ [Thiohalobacteraceae bacterium]